MSQLEMPIESNEVTEASGLTRRGHIAIISTGFWPIQHVRGTRATEMAAGLADLGYRVSVITVDWRTEDAPRQRISLERGCTVIRIDPREWYSDFSPTRMPFETSPPVRSTVARKIRTIWNKYGWGPWPEWARRAFSELATLHATDAVDVVWAINDDGSHEIASKFRKLTRVPWVADFKDPWNHFIRKSLWGPYWLHTWRRLRTSSALTETCGAQGELDARFGRPWFVIWSGYDCKAMSDAIARRVSGSFTIAYFGNADVRHDVAKTTRGLARWWASVQRPSNVELHVFGHEFDSWRRCLSNEGAQQILRCHRFVPRNDAFSFMKGVDALLLLPSAQFGRSRIQIGVKELEYFATGTPILCVGSLLQELDAEFGSLGQLLQASSENDASRFLDEEYAAFCANAISHRRAVANTVTVQAYSWEGQARRLANVLEQVMVEP